MPRLGLVATCLFACTLVGNSAVAQPADAAKPAAQEPAKETKEQFLQRTAWFREARFGMFIHWGVYAVPADSTTIDGKQGIGEWYFSNKQAQMKDYEKFAAQFNPVKFDAAKWVKTAKDAGMKYIVITSKHHDGFCMFDTKLTDWCITKATPFKRDPLKELSEECKKQGLKLCFYHSIMDWHHPDYLPRREWEKETRPAGDAKLDKYIEYMKGEIRELLTNYGPIGILWFDGGWEHNAQELHSAEVNAMIRQLQPGIIINDRNQLSEDYGTPEQTIPGGADTSGRLWETCMTINDTWGFAKNDTNWKSPEVLIRNLCDIAHKGGNFLLNVGPTAEGEFPDAINERLAAMGKWLAVNGEAIYGTSASPFKKLSFDGRCTRKGDKLYLHVFKWPADVNTLQLTGLETEITAARALDGGQKLSVSPGIVRATWMIGKPAKIDPIATVIELTLKGEPVVVTPAIRPDNKGVLTLKAEDAEIHGTHAKFEAGGGKDAIGFWTDIKDSVSWDVDAPLLGEYYVEVTYACPAESAGSTYTVAVNVPAAALAGGTVDGKVGATGDWAKFKAETLPGTLTLPAGKHTVVVHVKAMPNGAVMNLKQVKLTPMK